MNSIAIVTDSSCDLPEALLKQYNIHLLPIRIIYSDGEYKDRVEISPEEVYQKFEQEIPKSSLPSPEDTLKLFRGLIEQGYTQILGVFISSGLSGTFNMVRSVTEDLEGAIIELVDSKSLSLGAGFAVLEAAKTLEKTKDFEQAVAVARATVQKTTVFYVIKTLEYLKKGGRIGLVEGTIGELLNIKPIISVNQEGVYYTHSKVRGRNKSLQELYSLAVEAMGEGACDIGILHGDAPEEAQEIVDKFKALDHVKTIIVEQISPVLAVHTGPGLVGIVVSPL